MYTGILPTGYVKSLTRFCEELVPAVLNSEEGPLQPGSVRVMHMISDTTPDSEVIFDIEAYYFDDRVQNLEIRANHLKNAFDKISSNHQIPIFNNLKCIVWMKLVDAAYSSNESEPVQEPVLMNINAAIERLYSKCGYVSLE